MSTHRYGCPRCGSEQVREVQEVLVYYPVTAWDENGEPIDYGEPEVDWGSGEVVEERFRCMECWTAFDYAAAVRNDNGHIEVRIMTAGHSGECQWCGKLADGPLAVVRKRVTGPAGYTTEMDVGECCQARLVREYREQAERGEVAFIDARTTGPDLPRYH